MSEPLQRIETQINTSLGRMMTATEVRQALLGFLRRDLIGPAHGDRETLEDSPKLQYAAGILFPQDSSRNDSAAVAGIEDDVGGSSGETGDVTPSDPGLEGASRDAPAQTIDSEYDDLITLANSYRPSAVGLTFMVEASAALIVKARAAVYEPVQTTSPERKREYTIWTRRPLEIVPLTVVLQPGSFDAALANGLTARVVARARGQGRYLVTISL